jgi:tripartite-type tricarboxylate transporter receptor subunit TctC
MAHSQEKYPGRPIHLIVPMAAGGGTDRVARAFAEALKNFLPQPVLVENVAGAGSVTGMGKVHTSKPDGYTLGLASGYMISTALQGMTKYPANDFTLIAAISQDTFTFSVPAESKHKTFKEIVEASKADPDKITLANAGTGALTHLASVAINQSTGAKFRIVLCGRAGTTALLRPCRAGIFHVWSRTDGPGRSKSGRLGRNGHRSARVPTIGSVPGASRRAGRASRSERTPG